MFVLMTDFSISNDSTTSTSGSFVAVERYSPPGNHFHPRFASSVVDLGSDDKRFHPECQRLGGLLAVVVENPYATT
jgi:hypothetical protein